MSLFLVRHGSAVDRSRWPSDDLERPLDARGRAQADAITSFFAGRPVHRVLSSQATRCADTVAGLAEACGTTVEQRPELTEGARPSALVELLREHAESDDDVVMCSHGDLIPDALGRLLREGMIVVGPRGCKKGSIWELETRGRDIIGATYTAAP